MAQLDFGFRPPRKPRKPRKPKRGRPPKPGAGVPHRPRAVQARHPLHITFRVRRHVWQLRSRRCFSRIRQAFLKVVGRFDTRIAHFSIQHNHIHLLVETQDRESLARAMQGFAISAAKRLNHMMGRRRGAVFADRYHSRPLRTPSEVRAALVYVLNNFRKHTRYGTPAPDAIDPFSSGTAFDGWRDPAPPTPDPPPTSAPATWLLKTGWRRRGGPIARDETPRAD
jgi:REP-associated tyrosine transposase